MAVRYNRVYRPPALPAVAETLFEILEAQRILAGKARIALLPGGPHSRMLANLLAAENAGQEAAGPAKA